MRVLIVTAGGAGDVLPYTGLAARFAEAGHDVAIAAPSRYAPLLRERELEHRTLDGGQSEEAGSGATAGPKGRALAAGLSQFAALRSWVGAAMQDMSAAAQAGADVMLLAATCTPLGWHVAEQAGIPSFGVFLQPNHPTGEWPPVSMSGARSLGSWGNRVAAELAFAGIDWGASRGVKQFRAGQGLPRLGIRAMRRRMDAQRWPVCYGFSPVVVPRPADWRRGLEVVGYWWPVQPPGWQPQPELVEFLEAGPPPVFVGFGSTGMDAGQRRQVAGLVKAALRQAGVRGVIQPGLTGFAVEDDVCTIGVTPHDWLFPRVAAVVHHGGAGTSGAALRAGVPSVAVPPGRDPGAIDLPFWSQRLTALGTSPGWLLMRKLSAGALASLIRRAVTDEQYRSRASEVARVVQAEDGAGHVVEAVVRHVESVSSR